jgi:hypothetical protein
VGDECVLTAAHVVSDPLDSVRVRFDADRPGEWSADTRVVLLAETVDIALLEIAAPPPDRPPVEPLRYAALPDTDVTLPFSAVGFPRFKLRKDFTCLLEDGSPGQYRDSCHVSGMISVLSNRREGTLELAVIPPQEDVEKDRSPWEGMSGAAVWCAGALVGVVTAHHRSDGRGRLAAVRVERWYDTLSPAELELLRRCPGLPPRAGLALVDSAGAPRRVPTLTGLPADIPLRELMELVDALTALPILRSPNGMSLVLESISAVVVANSPRDPRLRMDVFGIVRTCLRYPGTLDQLLESVRLLEGPSAEAEAVDRAAVALARRHA